MVSSGAVAGKKFPRGTGDSHTTDKHVFKPPGDGGTVSQARADRYQNAGSEVGSPAHTLQRAPSSPPRSPPRGTQKKSQKLSSSVGLPSPERPPPVAAPMANDGLNLRKVRPPPELSDYFYPEAPLNPAAGKHGPVDILGVRTGMSHPPQNPKVRKKLLAYFHARKVPHSIELRKIKSPRRGRSPTSGLDESLERDASPEGGQGSSSASGFGSLPASPLSGQAGRRMVKSASMPTMKADGENQGFGRKKLKPAESSPTSWLDSLQEDQKKARPPPSEDEVQRKSEDLRRHSRYHGVKLGEVPARELATLAIYHNEVTRRHFPNPKHQAAATPAQRLRELRTWCIEQVHDDLEPSDWDFAERQASPGFLLDGPKLVRPLHYEDGGPLSMAGKASPARLRQVAEQMRHGNGPNRLQLMSRATGMSVITGAPKKDLSENL